QNTALYPLIDLLERVALRFEREESPQQKLSKLEGFVVQYGLPLVETVPLLAALLSLPLTADYAPLSVSPEQQKQRTLHALLTILLRIAGQQPRRQAVEVIRQVAHGKTLPSEVVEQIVAQTDGVPLFVEELTKMVLESSLLQEQEERYALTGPLPPLAIPATLHDSLMARLDRLATVKALVQLGATLGRTFAYDLLQAVSLGDEATL